MGVVWRHEIRDPTGVLPPATVEMHSTHPVPGNSHRLLFGRLPQGGISLQTFDMTHDENCLVILSDDDVRELIAELQATLPPATSLT